ncbi:SDR family oxidoreductase [Luteolibacter pohnpeiensis]|uniref:SDR family oxidoreductase n=1 Tax=Luteolibacter pohnpeiensis TaxID=454153 RepID=A0A934S2C6_9BACT|nr:SDR family oxidoreductase [Luteolibacter pohnpeiensis]MBK1881057.1 SDR family oxidoreductase [Luteolibacter pohnpeiensis]
MRTFPELHGKTVIITGAASGIGKAMSKILMASGATLYALDMNAAGLRDLADELTGPGQIHPMTLNVADLEAYRVVIREILQRAGSIDYLFNNAGVTLLGLAEQIPFERWRWLSDINLMGVIHGIELVYPLMIEQGRGHIVNTASVAGGTGYATSAAYTASKAAVLELSRSLRSEAKAYGVKVTVMCPGYVDSSIFSQERIVGADREVVINDLPVKMMSPDVAAAGLLNGVLRSNSGLVVYPLSSKILWTLSQWFPSALTPLHRRLIRVFHAEKN